MEKTFRVWAYSILLNKGQIVLIKKSRGPFEWMFDLPWGKIEHWENHEDSAIREINEEVWINDAKIIRLQNVYKYISNHEWKWNKYCEHILWIVYVCETNQLPNMDIVNTNEESNDSSDYLILDLNWELLKNYKFTPICEMAIKEYMEIFKK